MSFDKGKDNFKYIDGRSSKIHHCMDCEEVISYNNWRYGNKRCMSCAVKKRYKNNPEINPNYKDGRCSKIYYCKERNCNNKIHYVTWKYGLGNCKSCAMRKTKINRLGSWKRFQYKNIWMRSSYEVAYAKWLDKNQIKWFYESKAFDLGKTSYRPDFYLPEKNKYIEIKGWWRKEAIKKYKLFKKLYPKIKIKVLIKENLIKLGIKL